jgi:uncharacterized protein YndB with AHSA1/START domain
MSVKKEPSGRRSIQVEVEVPGTPEEVWEAIATGPGITSWFVPTELEGREGGTIVCRFGPGMEAVATVTAWDPPRRFLAEGEQGPGAPPLATEWIVEPRAGGRCVVRVVHSLFAGTDDWDAQLEGSESGWPGFFRILWLYLTHFPGERCAPIQVLAPAAGPAAEAWETLAGALGLAGARVGERRSAPADAPPLGGVVEDVGLGKHPHAMVLRTDEPAPGIVSLGAHDMGGQTFLALGFHLYGDRAPAAAARDEGAWRAWLGERFPAGEGAAAA